ncbi:MAG: hypothetical protein KJ072_09600 [Verrucomicrobia bacterium]|nr:hypothetical protein [Verrucomicrobiota bacterium]
MPRDRLHLQYALLLSLLGQGLGLNIAAVADPGPLRMSVYATAGDVQQHLARPEDRDRTVRLLEPLHVSRLWLEGRRGDEYVPPHTLDEIRAYLAERGIASAGGIATVPGQSFGLRQDTELGWLNWESPATQRDIAGFFTENAPVFTSLIVDDFYCTADTSPASESARGNRPWGQYRRDLLVSLLEPMIIRPAGAARADVQLILKYPQWYDRFHLFGYDPRRMSPPFDLIWVGTEVRNPHTRRMGYVQPTEGYVNFRWLAAVAGDKVRGAWFDHIECEPEHFVDQACQSVLAGAAELTLFRLGDIVQGHPGDALLARRLPELMALHDQLRGQRRHGIACYKPPGSDSDENVYLMDYLAMVGLPIVPVADYPASARVVILGVQAAADPDILPRMQAHLDRGATLVVTPAFLRAAGSAAARMAGLRITPASQPRSATAVNLGETKASIHPSLEVDGGIALHDAKPLLSVETADGSLPFLTTRNVGAGRLLTLNVRTFSEQDFREAGEWLLAPKPLGLPTIPAALANELRKVLLEPLGIEFNGPAGIGLYGFERGLCLYNFGSQSTTVSLNHKPAILPPKGWLWQDQTRNPNE